MKTKCIFLISLVILAGCAAQQHTGKGWSHLDKGEYQSAISEFELANEEKELHGVFLGLARTYAKLGDIETSVSYLHEGLQKFPEDGFLNLEMGRYLLHGKHDAVGALPYLKQAQERFKNSSISKSVDLSVSEAEEEISKR